MPNPWYPQDGGSETSWVTPEESGELVDNWNDMTTEDAQNLSDEYEQALEDIEEIRLECIANTELARLWAEQEIDTPVVVSDPTSRSALHYANVAGTAVAGIDADVAAAEAAAVAAEAAQAAAEAAQADAEAAAALAATAQAAAESAAASATAAKVAAEAAQAAAATAQAGAVAAQAAAESAATAAAVSATAADTSADNAADSENSAAASATAANISANNADASEAAAAASATAAQTAETNAETAETNAETAATNAAASATAANTAKIAAELAETNAETAETNAETAATAAAGSASAAAGSATAAAGSATAADASADAAAASAATAADLLDDMVPLAGGTMTGNLNFSGTNIGVVLSAGGKWFDDTGLNATVLLANGNGVQVWKEDFSAVVFKADYEDTAPAFKGVDLLLTSGGTMSGSVTFSDNLEGVILSQGGKLCDSSSGGEGGSARTILLAASDCFHVLDEAGSNYIFRAHLADDAPLFKTEELALQSWVNTNVLSGFKNKLINAQFIWNQRGYTSASAIPAGNYSHDRWKAGSGGCTFSFSHASQDTDYQITITAGTLQQVVEGFHVEGGVYTLSWEGTAQARIAINGASTSGAYAASPITTSSATAGQQITVEFNTGTLNKPQLENGAEATAFEQRSYIAEYDLCERYFEIFYCTWNGVSTSGANMGTYKSWRTMKRATPTLTYATRTSSTRYPLANQGSTGVTTDGAFFYYLAASAGGNEGWTISGYAACEL